MSSGSTFGSTVSGGIQDVSALLPLLGTEQCESHIGAGLDHGYLYPAAASLSIFGSLGIVKAGIKAYLASITSRRFGFIGAKALKDGGFNVEKSNGLSAIMFDDEGETYGAEKQLESILKDIHLKDPWRVTVKATPEASLWNVQMVVSSLAFSLLGMVPYIHLNLLGESDHTTFDKWLFPSMRVFGSFLVTVFTQFIMQHRILTIVRRKLISMAILYDLKEKSAELELETDVYRPLGLEGPTDKLVWNLMAWKGRKDAESPFSRRLDRNYAAELGKHLSSAEEFGWKTLLSCQFLLLLGSGLVITGYVGCFSIVQGSQTGIAPVIWLVLELVLSLIRICIWISNPSWDDKTNVRFDLGLSEYPPTPTVALFGEDILLKTLPNDSEGIAVPAVSEVEFLEQMLLYAGPTSKLAPRPKNEELSFFYTLAILSRKYTRYLLFMTVFDKVEGKAMTFRASPHITPKTKNIMTDAVLRVHEAEISPTSEKQLHYVMLRGKKDFADYRVTRDGEIMEKLNRHYFSIFKCLSGGNIDSKGLLQHWSNAGLPYKLVSFKEPGNSLRETLQEVFQKGHLAYQSISHSISSPGDMSMNLEDPEEHIEMRRGYVDLVNEQYLSYLSLSRRRAEMSFKLRQYGNLIEKKLISYADVQGNVEESFKASLITLENDYFREAEKVEIQLHFAFKSILEKLTRLFGPEMKKHLREGWGFEVTRHLSACTEKALRGLSKVKSDDDTALVDEAKQRWNKLVINASVEWFESEEVQADPGRLLYSLSSTQVPSSKEDISLDAEYEREKELGIGTARQMAVELEQEYIEDLTWRKDQETARAELRERELEEKQGLEGELERLLIREKELGQSLNFDYSFNYVTQGSGPFDINESLILNISGFFGVLAGAAGGVVCAIITLNHDFFKPGHNYLSSKQIVGVLFLSLLFGSIGAVLVFGIVLIFLPITKFVIRWTPWAIYRSVKWIFWDWWWNLMKQMRERRREYDQELRSEKNRHREMGVELGLDPQLVTRRIKELGRIQGLTWMRTRMLVLTLTLAKDRRVPAFDQGEPDVLLLQEQLRDDFNIYETLYDDRST